MITEESVSMGSGRGSHRSKIWLVPSEEPLLDWTRYYVFKHISVEFYTNRRRFGLPVNEICFHIINSSCQCCHK